MRVDRLIEEFLAQCRQGLSPSTVKFYAGRLKPFRDKFADREFKTLTLTEVVDYLEAAGTGRSDSTRRHNIVALERLQKFARERGIIRKSIFRNLKKPRIGQRDKVPTPEETAALLERASPEFRLIYSALRQCGARPSELCGARLEDIQKIEGQRAIVIQHHKTAAKTGRPRVIPIGKRLGALISEASRGRKTGPIFLTASGRPWSASHLSSTYRELRDRAGLPKHLCLYLARHEHASEICRLFDIHAAQQALGHADIGTTQRYVKTKLSDVVAHQDAFGGDSEATKARDGSENADNDQRDGGRDEIAD